MEGVRGRCLCRYFHNDVPTPFLYLCPVPFLIADEPGQIPEIASSERKGKSGQGCRVKLVSIVREHCKEKQRGQVYLSSKKKKSGNLVFSTKKTCIFIKDRLNLVQF